MQKEYKRKLSRTEAKRHYVYIEKKFADLFPPSGEVFKILVGKERLEVLIDRQQRIWAAMFRDSLPHFNEGDTVIFSKKQDGSYAVSIER